MKKLIFLVCCLIVLGGCTLNYNDIEPEPLYGTVVAIDSAQWTPVMIQNNENHILIHDGKTIKKVAIIDPSVTFLLGAITVIFLIFFVLAIINA